MVKGSGRIKYYYLFVCNCINSVQTPVSLEMKLKSFFKFLYNIADEKSTDFETPQKLIFV